MSIASELQNTLLHDELLRANKVLSIQVEKLKAQNRAQGFAIEQAVKESLQNFALEAVPKPPKDKRSKDEEVAVAWLSDWQLAKITSSYNSKVCEERIELYAQKVINLTEIQRADHPVKKCKVFITGDLIEGEGIFPGQHWLIDASLYEQICVDGPRILGNFLRTMLANFDSVEVFAVPGNHGRIGGRSHRDTNPESNGDRMLYRITQQILGAEKRLTWDIPDGNSQKAWYTIATIGNYKALLFHGDQIRGFSVLSIRKTILGWFAGAMEDTFTEALFGHYHQPTRITVNKITARCAGSTESDNEYAVENMAAVGVPSQPLLFVHPEKGIVTAEYCCWLDKE